MIGDGIRAAAGRALTRRNRIWRRSAAVAAAIPFVFCASLAPAGAAGLDPAEMRADAIKALEQRLTDAGCYKGAIDSTASSALDEAIKACPDQQPFLRIETGMHTAPVQGIGVDAACRLLATGSDDKTVRLWSLPDGKLQRILRLPIGTYGGRVYATAFSPDGSWLAAGGWDAALDKRRKNNLTVVGLSSGVIRRFGAFEGGIANIAYSADGRRVAVGLGGNNGVRVFDSAIGEELLADRDYGDNAYGLAFGPDSALVASSLDGQLRRYGPDLKLTVKRAAPDGKHPYRLAIDPSGQHVAVGYEDEPRVSILDAKTLAPLAKAQTGDLANGDLQNVAWSRDSATLLAGGKAHAQFQGDWRFILRRFDANGRRQGADIAASDSAIMDVQPCGKGFAFAAADPSLGFVSPQGVAMTLERPRMVDMRRKSGSAFAVAPDATSVRFGLGPGEKKPVAFDLAGAALTDSPRSPPGFAPAQLTGLPVSDWRDSTAPKFNGTKLALIDHEMSRSLAARQDAFGFVLGTNWSVRAYDAKGEQRWRRASPGIAWGVDLSADGEIVVVAYGDGTIRWLRWADGVELLALFVEPQSRKWVAWTPSGYYMASAGGEDLIGWHVNRGWNQQADFFPASQFRAQYNRPDIVRLVLQTHDEAEAVRRANAASARGVEAKPIAAALPPVVSILTPADGSHFSRDPIEIGYSLRSPSGRAVDGLDVLADGQPIPATGFEKTNSPETRSKVTATLPRKNTEVSLIAHSGDLTSSPVTVTLKYDGTSASPNSTPNTADLLKPKLYALLVGVTGYQNHDYDTLQFPARDAESLAAALEAQKGGLYSDVEIKIVDDPAKPREDPTRPNVVDGLYWLQRAATSRDISIIFLSGHGIRDGKQNFWFLTRDADLARLRATALSSDDLLDLISSIPGKKVLFIDACHAGAAMPGIKATESEVAPDMNKLVNDFSTAGSGLVVYGASMGTELSHEDAKWDRHGAFAEALIEAIGQGKAKIDQSGRITTDILDIYLEERVKVLTDGAQHPVMNRPALIPDFPLALARP